mmetsp:Transcript_103412/g.179690  ORF Transcript_103412/g.179690 Transcript_103412/m.179690 type:complete len:85 (+) Transcript_103412:2-256(+)
MKVNGALLWLSFILFRILLFPAWLICYSLDASYQYGELQSRGHLGMMELIVYPATTLFLWILSCVWFKQIHAGMMKMVFKQKET